MNSLTDRRFFGLATEILMAACLVTLGVVGRLALQESPNLSPVAGLAIAGGFLLSYRLLATLIPIATLLISDRWLGGYDLPVMITVYTMLTLPVLFGRLGRTWWSKSTGRESIVARSAQAGLWGAGSGLISAILFFLTTNAAWCFFSAPAGTTLIEGYTLALPFFQNTLKGDIVTGCCATAIAAIWLIRVAPQPSANPVKAY